MIEHVTENNLAEYERFVEGHRWGHFLQSHHWAAQKPEWEWVAIMRRDASGGITGSLAALVRRIPGFPCTLMYAGRGPVCDPHDAETFAELTEGAKELAKKYRAYSLKLDPDILHDDAEFMSIARSLGFRITQAGKSFEAIQPRFVFRMNIEGKTKEEVMESFHPKTRYNIRLAQRKGVEVRICGYEAVSEFARLMEVTGERDRFVTRTGGYFSRMLYNMGDHARLYMAYWNGVAIAGTLAILYGDKVWYLYGASSNEYRNLMPNYLLQWNMISWAVENGCRLYDFRGVSGYKDENNPLYGLYRFKKGFNGEFTEFVGELDYEFNPLMSFAVTYGGRAFRNMRAKAYRLKRKLFGGGAALPGERAEDPKPE